jgi:GTP cyclohydrolase IA
VHLVCPHHLTVALGHAHLAYLPRGRVVGFGALTRLARALTARLVLQEDATRELAEALVAGIDAGAAAAMIEAAHPCHSVAHAGAHDAQAVTFATAGDERSARRLEQALRDTSRRSRR